jgi:glycosyltransferase involved in cell wall biosynthesis
MRITFVNHSRRKIGGAEIYLDCVIPALAHAGHEIAFLHEGDLSTTRDPISLPSGAPCWNVLELGRAKVLESLRAWRPDICFTHGLQSPDLESEIVRSGPCAFYVHDYYGTCISGEKTWSNGTPRPCDRRFGPACLLHYFPHRCGGLNPFTMWELYQRQSRRLELMRQYSAVIANSRHIKQEMERHGVASEALPCPVNSASSEPTNGFQNSGELRLIFAGRMTALKGGQFLVAALPEVSRRLRRPLHVLFAGEGQERGRWESAAQRIQSSELTINFPGWLANGALHEELRRSLLLVYPSVWPEPFGLSGLEAGCYGVPTVAFPVGGIPEWLHDGVNGHLASLPASPASLADAIIRCLEDNQHYESLRIGARKQASEYKVSEHVAKLTRIFERCTA